MAVPPEITTPKRIYDRLKRNHIRHIVKTTREKINQSLSSFKRSTKSKTQCCDQEIPKRGHFFSNSYSDSDLHLSVQQMIENKSSPSYEHFNFDWNTATKQPHHVKLSRFSSVDNLLDDDFKDLVMADYENELNHAKKRSFFKTSGLQRQQRLSSQRDKGLRWWQKQRTIAKSSTSSSNKLEDSNSEGEYSIDHSERSAICSKTTNDILEEMSLQPEATNCSSSNIPPVPDWNELCNRVYRFRIKLPDHALPWNLIDTSSEKLTNRTSSSHFLQTKKSDSSNSLLETITPSYRQAPPSSPTSNKPKGETQSGPLLQPESSINASVEPKIQFDVKSFIGSVAKRIFALKENSSDRASLEAAIDHIELSHLNENDNAHLSVRAFKTFLLDLCKEQSKSTFCADPTCSMSHFSLMLPLRCQRRPWPQTEDLFVKALLERIESLSVLKADALAQSSSTSQSALRCSDKRKCAQNYNLKRYGLMTYCRMQRKIDLVDSVLYQEMAEDEHQWTYQGPEIVHIKEELVKAQQFN